MFSTSPGPSLAWTLAAALSLPATALAALAPPPAEGGPSDARPASSVQTPHHEARGEHTGPRVAFDEVLGLSADAPALALLEAGLEHRRASNDELPRLDANPKVQLGLGARLPPAPEAGFEMQLSVTQSWNLAGYGRKRRAAAEAETEVLDTHLRAEALEQRLATARAWVLLHGAERRLELAQGELVVDNELVATLERAHGAGVATRIDVAEARVLAADAQAVVTELAGEVHDLGLELASETGERATAPLRTRGDYPDPSLPSEVELRERFADLDQLPSVALHALEARAARARATESRAQKGSRLTTGVQINRESPGDVIALGVVGGQLGAVDHNQRQQARQLSAAYQAEAQGEARAVALSAHLQVALHDLHHTQERMTTLGEQTLPALSELVAARKNALALGEGTRAQVLRARHRHSAATREYAAAEAAWVWARVEVWLYLEAVSATDSQSATAGGPR